MELAPKKVDSAGKSESSFTFLAVEPQNERPRLSAGVRKQMKRHLTLLQHKRTRQQRAAKTSSWLTSSLGRQELAAAADLEEYSTSSSNISEVRLDQQGPSTARCEDGGETTESMEFTLKRRNRDLILQLPSGVLEESFSRGSMAFRTFALTDSDNVIGKSLSRIQLDVSSVLVSSSILGTWLAEAENELAAILPRHRGFPVERLRNSIQYRSCHDL